jgi:uncharacterized protein YegP (UPF0339 family)
MSTQVEFFSGNNHDTYWRILDASGDEVNRSSEGFTQAGGAKNNLLTFHTLLSIDLLALHNRQDCVSLEFYTDLDNKTRWRVKASNGEIVGAAHKGFSSLGEAKNNVLMTYSLISTYIASVAMEA